MQERNERLEYVVRMLIDLRGEAAKIEADMLAYLIEMALVEAEDVKAGRRPRVTIGRPTA